MALIGISNNIYAGTYGGGSGIEGDPYLISDPNHMQEIGADPCDWDSHFLLTNDIDLGRFTGTEFNIIGNDPNAFTGVFDGDGYSVLNFTYTDSTRIDNIGLFGLVDDPNVEIKNLILVNTNLAFGYNGSSKIGSLVGYFKNGTISKCSVIGVYVSGTNFVGGLVGLNDNGIITESFVKGDPALTHNYIMAASLGGGLIGRNSGIISECHTDSPMEVSVGWWDSGGITAINTGSIFYSYSTCTVSAAYSGVGGLVASNYGGIISNCYATGHTYRTVDGSGGGIGGLVGYSHAGGVISNSYAKGNVEGDSPTGGLVGRNRESTIEHCYAVGEVIGDINNGGFVGTDDFGFYNKCFRNSDINPTLNGIGNITDPNVIGKTTYELKQQPTFTNWDFTETWGIEDNQTYPFLRLTYPVGDINLDKKVDLIDLSKLAEHWLEGI